MSKPGVDTSRDNIEKLRRTETKGLWDMLERLCLITQELVPALLSERDAAIARAEAAEAERKQLFLIVTELYALALIGDFNGVNAAEYKGTMARARAALKGTTHD